MDTIVLPHHSSPDCRSCYESPSPYALGFAASARQPKPVRHTTRILSDSPRPRGAWFARKRPTSNLEV